MVNVWADERVFDENSKIDLNKFSPITYEMVHHVYCKICDIEDKAFCDGKRVKEL